MGGALLRAGALLLLDAPGGSPGAMAVGDALGTSFAQHTQLVGCLSTGLDHAVERRAAVLCSTDSRGLSTPAGRWSVGSQLVLPVLVTRGLVAAARSAGMDSQH